MRKRIVQKHSQGTATADEPQWLDLEHLVQIEVTSEQADHPVESALMTATGSGWRAQQPGQQSIRLLFDKPHRISRIQLLFAEDEQRRTQQFVLSGSGDGGNSWSETVRQQYNFSPPDTAREREDYRVDLNGVTALELRIRPDIIEKQMHASLAQLRIE